MEYLKNFKLFESTAHNVDDDFINLFNLAIEDGDIEILELFMSKSPNMKDININLSLCDSEKFRYLIENGGVIDDIEINRSNKEYLIENDIQSAIIDNGGVNFLLDNNIPFCDEIIKSPKYKWVTTSNIAGLL